MSSPVPGVATEWMLVSECFVDFDMHGVALSYCINGTTGYCMINVDEYSEYVLSSCPDDGFS